MAWEVDGLYRRKPVGRRAIRASLTVGYGKPAINVKTTLAKIMVDNV
jgi:hypothetical protein